MNSKLFDGVMANLSNWYESKTLKAQNLIDVVCEKTRFVKTEKQYDTFIASIAEYGIDNAEKFANAFFAEYEGTGPDVLELFINDWLKLAKGCLPKRVLKESKPEQLWNELIRFDFHQLDINGHTYFVKRSI